MNTSSILSKTSPKLSKRKNNPQQLRHTLLNTTKTLIATEGISGLSMQKVADGAGVSKGGLFHHFKSKDELIYTVIQLYINKLNAAILEDIAIYGQTTGAFTKAYVRVFFDNTDIGLTSDWSGLIYAISTQKILNELWQSWLDEKLQQFHHTDSNIQLSLVRYAVDGIWLSTTAQNLTLLKAHLLTLIDTINAQAHQNEHLKIGII